MPDKNNEDEKPQDEFNFGEAWQARDEGIERVLGNEREKWKLQATTIVSKQPAPVRVPFTGESLRLFVYPLIGRPHHHNVWGAMFNKWIKEGRIIKTGEESFMKTKISHGRSTDLYQWP
jgi:hypothetical protein